MTDACDDCKFYAITDNESGQCRRYAPRMDVDLREKVLNHNDEPESGHLWPTVYCEFWCGEFKKSGPQPA